MSGRPPPKLICDFFRRHHQIETCETPDFEVHKKYTAVFHITKTA